MGVKRAVKRGAVKVHRKVFGKPKEIEITTARGGLTKTEIGDILHILEEAYKNREIPHYRYEYEPPIPILASRKPLYLIPKTVSVPTFRRLVNKVIRREYGVGYIIGGYGGGNTGVKEPKPTVSKRTRLGRKTTPRITPKRPKLRR